MVEGCPPAYQCTMLEQIMLQPVEEPLLQEVDLARRSLWPVESPRKSRPIAHKEKPIVEQVVCQEVQPMRDSCCCSLFLKICTPQYRPKSKQVLKNCCLWEFQARSVHVGLHPWGGALCWSSNVEGVASWTDCNPCTPFTCATQGQEVEEDG